LRNFLKALHRNRRSVVALGLSIAGLGIGGWLVSRDFPTVFPIPTKVVINQHSQCGGRLVAAASIDAPDTVHLALILGRQPHTAIYERAVVLPQVLSTSAALEEARQRALTSSFSKLPVADPASGLCDLLRVSVGASDGVRIEPLAAYVERDRHICSKDDAECLKLGTLRDDLAVVSGRAFWLSWGNVTDSFAVEVSAMPAVMELTGEGLQLGANRTTYITAKNHADSHFRYYGVVFRLTGQALNLGQGTSALRLNVHTTAGPSKPQMISIQAHASAQFGPSLSALLNSASTVGRDFYVQGSTQTLTEDLRWSDLTFDRRRNVSDMIAAMLIGFGFTLLAELLIASLGRGDA